METCGDFNTSHVTVYPINVDKEIVEEVFQYISCYCLSRLAKDILNIYGYFNTSHVTVYHCINNVIGL